MRTSNQPSDNQLFVVRALEATIRIGIVILLLYWCFQIARPFIGPIAWGIIIAVGIHPSYERVKSALGGRDRLAAALITLLALLLLLVPAAMLFESMIETVQGVAEALKEGTLKVPPPPESVRAWPIIGETVYGFWSLGSNNLGAALGQMAPALKHVGISMLSAAANAGVGLLMFVVSIVIAGVLLANADAGRRAAQSFAARLAGERGSEFVDLAGSTVRSVAQGILGVALIQSVLAGLGCLVMGVPGAGFWALLVLILAVVQLPTILVLGPIIFYVFATASTLAAVLFMIWSLLVGVSDAFLKPLLMGRGAAVPMPVIFIGAIGGFVSAGIIGLFVGAIVLALGYKLFLAWLDQGTQPEQAPGRSE
jgi:predicted PurR-regulated permease PerM